MNTHYADFNMLNLINIEKLNGNNFKTWKQQIEMHLGMLEFDIAFKLPQPSAHADNSTTVQRDLFAKWERANQMSLLIMQNAMEEHVRGGIPACDLAKAYMDKVEEKFKRSDKVETGSYLSAFINAKHDDVGSIREHLFKLVNISNKLNALDIGITDQFLVHMALHSLSSDYEQIKVNYNTQKKTWSINELIAICCQEEERMKRTKIETINVVQVEKGQGKAIIPYKNNNYKGSKPHNAGSHFPSKKNAKHSIVFAKNNVASTSIGLRPNAIHLKKCYYCQSTEHLRKNCPGFKGWLIKKGISKPE
ncbi:uncharacterized protein LOC126632510 [Malus sylvestris]|uniref:uncharacterized protein LOC126632510 n=1 Tax=Malus sylvestris TaxID=3752 RepID=UPI0021AC03D5|nr:uncharacterized protein LOC126632510 [Malus sylvestris]